MKLFEGWRSAARQSELYAQGRTKPGAKVTNAKAWQSYHQHGVAADLVLYEDGKWSWDTSGKRAAWWKRMQAIGRDEGLEPLSWELPHLQLPGLRLVDLRAGRYPDGGDTAWAENLAAAIRKYPSGAPPAPKLAPERPPLPDDAPEPDDEPTAGDTPAVPPGATTVTVAEAGEVNVTAADAAAVALPVPGGGPDDAPVKANRESLITKIQFWATRATTMGGTAGAVVATVTGAITAVSGLSAQAQVIIVGIGAALIVLIILAAGLYFLVGAVIAAFDHESTKAIRSDPAKVNVK